MTQLVQIADDQGTDTEIVRLIGTGEANLVPLFTYLISEDGSEKFFLQVSSPNRNLSRFSPSPFDSIALSQMLALIEDRGYEKDALVSHVRFYEADIIAHTDGKGKPQTPFTRPSTGAVARPAETDEIERYLRLPKPDSGEADDGNDFRIGKLARSGDATVPIIINEHIFNHHILVAGATGSGKSHLLANLAHVADAMNRCIILFDHKPDHQDHHKENREAEFPRKFCLGENATSDSGPVRYWTLDRKDPNTQAILLEVPARELDPEILAGAIFHRAGEENQAETLATIATAYAEQEPGKEWTIHQLVGYIRTKRTKEIQGLFGDADISLHSGTLQAIKRKLYRPESRIPSFIDPVSPTDALGNETRQTGHIDQVFHRGLNVIRIIEGDRGYALFLSHLLGRADGSRSQSIQSGTNTVGGSVPEMLMIIDEAADIFKADSRYLRDAATGMLAERIRKGRSLQIGYVIAVQDAGDVPENIRHNLNTTIVGRHRHIGVLREALPTVREGLLSSADKLDPGEMLVDLFGVSSLLLVKMDLSRSNLTVAT